MATLLLAAAGSAIGGAIGGAVLGIGAATIGQAAGALAGAVIDQRILGEGSRAVETGRARSLRLQGSAEGTPIPRVWGRMRLAGTVIWSTRYLETVSASTRGGKATGGARVRDYSYSISLAVAVCEGPVDRIGRIWADGKPLDLAGVEWRLHPGTADQLPDPKIEAVEGAGNVPAYRGTAYVVFEDLPVGPYGNRIPQFSFEVFRSVEDRPAGPEAGAPLPDLVQAVALSPGTGEFALEPRPAAYLLEGGGRRWANVNSPGGRPDLLVALDQLQAGLPACTSVSLVVSWFGSDLRAGHCRVEPKVEEAGRTAEPEPWSVSGLTPDTAATVSADAQGRPVYGGTPSDASVIGAIGELAARGLKVMVYPFLLMDIPAGNGLPDPHGGAEQAAFPWRGRITGSLAPGQPGSPDQTAAAAAEVAAFFGTVRAADFTVTPGAVAYTGPAELSWSRFVLHMAALAAAAGGVEAFCIGSELRGLTTLRSDRTTYPAVQQLIALAAEVRALLPGARLSYAADWSEYFGHQPGDGTGDRLFHLDPLWADGNIDFVGIDDYLPLSDWRHEPGHADAGLAPAPHSLPYLMAGVEGGEHYDWYYASDADRAAQIRTPIADTAHGEHWVFRPKDIRGWWANAHHDRIGGVRQPAPTAWVPMSKPVWLTETGCPAVDLGANMPNLFLDPKSAESGLPPGSAGARDDEMQRRYLQAKLGYWSDPANNPVSPLYGGEMIPPSRIHVWTWDARPFPDFPVRGSVWADGPAHQLGHWITGRVGTAPLAEVVHEIARRGGVADADVSRLFDTVYGFAQERGGTAREALQPLMLAYGLDAHESGGRLVFTMRGQAGAVTLDSGRAVASDAPLGAVVAETASPGEATDAVRLTHVEAEGDYRLAAAEARRPEGAGERVAETSLPLALPGSRAARIAERWLAEAGLARERLSLALPPSMLALEPADVIALPGPEGLAPALYRIERVTEGGAREIEAVRIDAALYLPAPAPERHVETALTPLPGPLTAVFLDLPLADGTGLDHAPHLAVAAEPWPGAVTVWRSATGSDFAEIAEIRRPATIGALAGPLPPCAQARWQRAGVEVLLPGDGLAARERLAVLSGANALALEAAPGQWEILLAQRAELVGPGRYRLSHLIRGLRGTEALAAQAVPAGARLVVLDAAVARLPLAADERALPRHWRVVPHGRALDDPATVGLEAGFAGLGLRPFAAAHLRARRLPSGDIALSWVRRTRIGGDGWEGVDVPLSEEAEAYRVRILSGGALLREIAVAAPAATYTAAAQAADGAAGPLAFRVAQLSAAFGYGLERETILDD